MDNIEIDQSGKVEYTSSNTVIGDSKGNSVFLNKRDKRIIQRFFREAGKSRKFVIEIFSILLVLVIIKSFSKENDYFIDIEYPGRSDEIKNYIIKFCKQLGIDLNSSQIHFKEIGKKSQAHEEAYLIFKGRKKVKKIDRSKIFSIILQ